MSSNPYDRPSVDGIDRDTVRAVAMAYRTKAAEVYPEQGSHQLAQEAAERAYRKHHPDCTWQEAAQQTIQIVAFVSNQYSRWFGAPTRQKQIELGHLYGPALERELAMQRKERAAGGAIS